MSYVSNVNTDRIIVGSPAHLDDMADGTVIVWFRPDYEINVRIIVSKSTNPQGWILRAGQGGSSLIMFTRRVTTNQTIGSQPILRPGQWSFVAGRWSTTDTFNPMVYYGTMHEPVREVGHGSLVQGAGALTSDASVDLELGNMDGQNLSRVGAYSTVWVYDRCLGLGEIARHQYNLDYQEGAPAFHAVEMGLPDITDRSGNNHTVTSVAMDRGKPLPYRGGFLKRFFAFPKMPAQLVAVGLASEADSAFDVSSLKEQSVGLSSEADSALAVGILKAASVGLATETDTAFAIAAVLKVLAIGLASEADSAFDATPVRLVSVGLSSETDTAFALANILKVMAVGLASEADSALALSALKTLELGLASEADSAFAVGKLKTMPVGLATEADSAFPVSTGTGVAVGLATEADSAFAIANILKTMAVGLASEADSAFAIGGLKVASVGLASEADSAFALSSLKTMAVGLASELDTAFAVGRLKVLELGLSTEADSAFGVTGAKLLAVGLATEADSAFDVGAVMAFILRSPTTIEWTSGDRGLEWTAGDRGLDLTSGDRTLDWEA